MFDTAQHLAIVIRMTHPSESADTPAHGSPHRGRREHPAAPRADAGPSTRRGPRPGAPGDRRTRREPPVGRGGRPRADGRASGRRRASLSVGAIVDTAIAMLDRDGAQRLTLRNLAAELDSGVASLYWYASGKDELMAMVADEVLGRALREFHELSAASRSAPEQFAGFTAPAPDERTSAATAAALADLRCLSLCLFAQMLSHRWLAAQLIQAGPDEENALRTWESTGQILQRMELTTAQQFHASLAVTNYASGMGAEISQRQQLLHAADAAEMFREQLERWAHASTQDFPFVHSILGEFRRHDDRAEYIAGLDLLLSGIERQTWGRAPAG